MVKNYLKGTIGDDMNAFLAAAGFNLRGLLNKIKKEILWPIFYFNKTPISLVWRQKDYK